MLENLVMLQSYTYYGSGEIGKFLDVLSQAGFFSYLLPFLLIFALVYGILTKLKLFEATKAVNAIIALAVGLLALQFDFVPTFFSEIFPRVGIGLAIILVILILMGLFIPSAPWVPYALFGVSAFVVIVILLQTGGVFGSDIGNWFYDNWPFLAGLIFTLIALAVVVSVSNKKEGTIEVPVPFFPWTKTTSKS